jgi:transcriptional regulator with XRE-family HTH domain
MNNDELRNRIKYLREVEQLSTRQIAEKIGISRGRCLRICSGKPGADRIPALSFLDPYRSLVGEWYATHPTLKASQVWQRLVDRGVKASYTSVKRLTRPFRKKPSRSY